jgi:hypothetical protein
MTDSISKRSILHDMRAPFMRSATVLLLAGGLSACASIEGRPKAITSAHVTGRVCPTDAKITAFNAMDPGEARAAFRDQIVAMCISAYNKRYAEFTTALSQESVSTNLAVNIASSTLTTLSGIASPKTAKRLGTGAAVALGLGAAVNKDVFYSATLPALLTAIEAKRSTILSQIVAAQKADRTGMSYSLSHAIIDLDRYEDAGTLSAGLNELNKAAAAAAQAAGAELAVAQEFTAVVLKDDVKNRTAALTAKVRALDKDADKPKLDALATKLGLTPSAGDTTQVKIANVIAAIVARVNTRVEADQTSAVAKLETDLNPLF